MTKSILFILFFCQILIVSAQVGKVDSMVAKPRLPVDKYDLLILKAANAVANEDFEQAKALYTEAISIKPSDPFASGMLITANNSLKALEVIRLRNSDLKRKDDINKLLNQAQAEVMAKNYENARIHYNQVLSLQPIKSQEEFVKQRLRAIDFASDGLKKSTLSNTGASNNLLVVSEERSSTGKVDEQKNINVGSTIKSVVEPVQGVAKTEKDSLQTRAELTGKHNLNQKSRSENEKNVVLNSALNQPSVINKTLIKEQSNPSSTNVSRSNDDLAKQTALQKQNDDLKKRAQENESKKVQANSSVSLIASQNRIEPMKEDLKTSSINTNTKDVDTSKQIALQKQNDEAKKKVQENEIKKLPATTVNAIHEAVGNGSVKEKGKLTVAAGVSNNNSLQSKEVEKQNDNYEAAKKAKVDSLIENAIKAINTENWETALNLYTQVLALHPTPLQQTAINSEITVIKRNIDKMRSKSPDTNIAKTISPAVKVNPVATTANSSSKSGSLKTGESQIAGSGNKNSTVASVNDATSATAIASRPNVVESAPSIDPSSNAAEMDTKKENVEFSKRLITEAALSHLNDNNNEVRITCQNISTNDKNVFLKFLIQNNNAAADFNIGSLQLTVIKNDGNLKKLHPKYIAESAHILPKKESSMVVVAENQTAIEPSEAVVFEMEDQSKKTKLTINISGNNFSGKSTNQGKSF